MCSPGVSARDWVLAELAGLGPGTADPLTLLDQVRDLAGFIDRAQGELARLTGALDAVGGAAEAGYSSTAAFLPHGCGRSPGRAGELAATGRGRGHPHRGATADGRPDRRVPGPRWTPAQPAPGTAPPRT